MQKFREGLLAKLRPKDRELIERMKTAIKGQPLEEVLKKLSRNNSDAITEDDFVIAFSKLNANLFLSDVKDFMQILKSIGSEGGNKGGPGTPQGPAKISIAETV